jgi:hypothetical protein
MTNCKAKLFIGDDYGDNTATMRCQLPGGHDGPHLESFIRDGKISITWEKDETTFAETWVLANKDLILKDYLDILNDRDSDYLFVIDTNTDKILRIESASCALNEISSNEEYIWREEIKDILHEHGYI